MKCSDARQDIVFLMKKVYNIQAVAYRSVHMDEIEFKTERLILAIGNSLNSARDKDLAKNNFSFAQSEAILFFGDHEGQSIKELAINLKISHQGAQKLVDKLIAKDILTKEISAEDKRYSRIYLSDTGKQFCKELIKTKTYSGEYMLEGFADFEKKQLYEYLQRIGKTLGR